MAERKASVAIIGDASRLVRAMRQAASATDRFTKGTDKNKSRLDRMSMAARVAGAAVLGLGVVGLKKAASAAVEAEASNARLTQQLKTLGQNSVTVRGNIDRTVQSLSMLSGYDDEALQDAFTTLVRTTGDVVKGQKQLGLVADIARGRQIGLAQAAAIVNRVNVGNIGGLKRLGIEVDKNTTKQQAMALLQSKFAGQAQAYGQTAAGAQERLGVVMENAFEAIGTALTPLIIAFTNWASNVLPRVVSWLTQNKNIVLGVAAALGVLWTALAGARAINTFAQAFKVLNLVMKGNVFLLIAAAVIAVGAALYMAYQRSEGFRQVVQRIWAAAQPVAQFLANVLVLAFKGLAIVIAVGTAAFNKIRAAVTAVWGALKTVGGWIKSAASAVFGTLSSAVHIALSPLIAMKEAISWIIDHLPDIEGKGGNPLKGGAGNNRQGGGYFGKEMSREMAGAGRQARNAGRAFGDGMKESIRQARSNLASLASSFASKLGEAKRAGYRDPVTGLTVAEMRANQDKILTDRRRAELQAAVTNAQTAEDRARAQQELDDFTTEQSISAAESAADAAGKTAENTVAQLAAMFNSGQIDADTFKTKLNEAIGGETGNEIGTAFALEFSAALSGLEAQIDALKNAASVVGLPGDAQDPSGQSDYEKWLTPARKKARNAFRKKLLAAKKNGLTPAEVKSLGGITSMYEWDTAHGAPAVALARGGIVTSPVTALMGEAGREAVIPLDDVRAKKMLTGASAARPVVNLTFNGVLDAKDAARKLRPELDRLVRLAV